MPKAKAADRTIDLFTGQTREETIQAAVEEVQEAPREPFTGINGEVDRWREGAFTSQQWTTDVFYGGDSTASQEACTQLGYRFSSKGGWLYMELLKAAKGETYGYTGYMLPLVDLPKVLEALLKVQWARDKEATKALFREVCK